MLSLHCQIILIDPILDQVENRILTTKEIKETVVAATTVKELPDIPMPKEVRKKWTYDICQLTFLSEKILNLHLQGKKHKTIEAPQAKKPTKYCPSINCKEN